MRSGQVDERVAYRETEFLLFVELAELSSHGLGDFVGNHFEGGGKCMSGANGAGERVDGLGKLLLKFGKTLGPHMRGISVGKKKTEQGAGPAKQQVAAGDEGDSGEHQGRSRAEHQEISGANIHVALGQHFLQKRDALRAAEKGVEGRYPAEYFVAQKGCLRRGLFRWFLNGGKAVTENASLRFALIEQRHGGKDRQGDRQKHERRNSEQHLLDLHP